MTKISNYDMLKSMLGKKGGFFLTGWCENQKCEDKIKDETGADIRIIPFDGQEESESTVCVYS